MVASAEFELDDITIEVDVWSDGRVVLSSYITVENEWEYRTYLNEVTMSFEEFENIRE